MLTDPYSDTWEFTILSIIPSLPCWMIWMKIFMEQMRMGARVLTCSVERESVSRCTWCVRSSVLFATSRVTCNITGRLISINYRINLMIGFLDSLDQHCPWPGLSQNGLCPCGVLTARRPTAMASEKGTIVLSSPGQYLDDIFVSHFFTSSQLSALSLMSSPQIELFAYF